MCDNKDDPKNLRDIANIFKGWSSDAEKGKYKNNEAEAEKIIRDGLEKAADLMPLINSLKGKYILQDRDPELNNAIPYNALCHLEVRYINQDEERIDRHVRLLVNNLIKQEPLGYLQDYLALAKELNRWAEKLEDEFQQVTAQSKRRTRKRRSPYEKKIRPLTEKQAEAVHIVGECKGSISEASRRIGIDPKSLRDRYNSAMKKLGQAGVRKPKTIALPHDQRGQVHASKPDDRRG